MNINQAKEQIRNAITAYFTKDEFGNYVIPIEKQRPVFLMGPPGIGKTAIMEQIAAEMNVGLISYSMTHHTRQSALGLPFIEKKTYGDKEYSVSEYTMSEIIASVYDMIENTGHTEGILFLDEINCVSETLAPAMLQFLQYKIFGKHRVPDGWIVVTAGNPPEYNNSVREFDIVTWDRLKRIDIEPDYEAWKDYAYAKGIHASITSYLETKNEHFYQVESTVDGKSFVTARGWSDLSDMIHIYEQHGLTVDRMLIEQYLQNEMIARSFASYYNLFNKYKTDYKVESILAGKADDEVKSRAKNGAYDERLAVLGLIIDAISIAAREVYNAEAAQAELRNVLQAYKLASATTSSSAVEILREQKDKYRKLVIRGKLTSSISPEKQQIYRKVIEQIEEEISLLNEKNLTDANAAFVILKESYDAKNAQLKASADEAGKKFSNAFKFCEEVFGNGQELLILVTDLTVSPCCAHFISTHGCDEYFAHNKDLLFYERQQSLLRKIENFDVD